MMAVTHDSRCLNGSRFMIVLPKHVSTSGIAMLPMRSCRDEDAIETASEGTRLVFASARRTP